MIVLPNMGLVKWDQINDSFSHEQLAANFQSLDDHDHTPGKGKQITTGGLAPLSVAASNLQDNVVTAEKVGAGAITTANLVDGSVTDSKLASPITGVYRSILETKTSYIGTVTAGTYVFGSTLSASAANQDASLQMIYYTGTEYAVNGKTTKLNLNVQIACNATAPGMNFTVGLYPVTVAGAASHLSYTTGTVVSGSTVLFTAPTASTVTPATSGDFTPPSTGAYILGVVTSGSTAANSAAGITAQLRVRNV